MEGEKAVDVWEGHGYRRVDPTDMPDGKAQGEADEEQTTQNPAAPARPSADEEEVAVTGLRLGDSEV